MDDEHLTILIMIFVIEILDFTSHCSLKRDLIVIEYRRTQKAKRHHQAILQKSKEILQRAPKRLIKIQNRKIMEM